MLHSTEAVERGYWLDLRSKRDIRKSHLNDSTCAAFNFYDPLLSPKVGVVSLKPPEFDWLANANTRSWQLNLHSFRFADYWILHYQESGDRDVLLRLHAVVNDYITRIWSLGPSANHEFIHSDVSVAARAAVIAYLIGRLGAGEYSSSGPQFLSSALAEHVEWAADDANYTSNNHGLFNDMHLLLGLVNAKRDPALSRVAPAVLDRLMQTFLDRQVNEEGVHLEHTPAYALLWILLGRKLERLLDKLAKVVPELTAGADRRLSESIDRVAELLWWFTKPEGELINLGDQGRTDAPGWVRDKQGKGGIQLFRESGYAVYKEESSYLAFVGAYHSTKAGRSGYRSASHKQRDELHLVWTEAGQDILVDTGLRAYDFGPERRYTYSKQAHNTLSLDRGDYLTDGILKYMDATEPYGSAVRYAASCQNGSGWIVMAGEDPLLARKKITHWRMLLLHPGKCLVICDLVRLPKGNKAEWNFHLAEQWRCANHTARSAEFRCRNNTLSVSRFASSEVTSASGYLHRGDFEPLRGWRFAGDPFAINNLRFVEWLAGSRTHLRATGFCLGSSSLNLNTVSFEREADFARVRLVFLDRQHEDEVAIDFSPPLELLPYIEAVDALVE